jgi:hypothetical protein
VQHTRTHIHTHTHTHEPLGFLCVSACVTSVLSLSLSPPFLLPPPLSSAVTHTLTVRVRVQVNMARVYNHEVRMRRQGKLPQAEDAATTQK